jgi:ABC transporter with metal-binding/Fe-S-binding domain ATP-binding protein
MRVAALASGGKDSTYAMYVAMQRGWEVASLVSIQPRDAASMLYHVPNVRLTRLQAEAMDVPIVEEAAETGEAAELDGLRRGLARADGDAVVVGAIASDYQHSRIDRVAEGLGLRVFAPLWRHDPHDLVRDYLSAGLRIVFSSVAAEGLDASWLGRPWDGAAVEDLLRLEAQRGVHPCGEGGEFETLVLDAPFFRKRIAIEGARTVWHGTRGVYEIDAARLVSKGD